MILSVSEIERKNFNERDVEVPALLSVTRTLAPRSVLDVGAHYSWFTYAPAVREMVRAGCYEAVDLLADARTAEIVDFYHMTDVAAVARRAPRFDLVFSVSVIEHVGVKPSKQDGALGMRREFLRTILSMAGRAAFLTFPFGLHGECLGEAMNVTDDELLGFEEVAAELGLGHETQFFGSPRPALGEPWFEVSREEASAVPLRLELGCACVGLLLLSRGVQS